MLTKKITDDFTWVGTLDPDLRVFDIVMDTEHGTTYNSYLLQAGDVNVLFEASKANFTDEYIDTVSQIVPIENIKYLVVSHTEPDHSGTIERLVELNPNMEIIATMGGANFLKEITNRALNIHTIKDGETMKVGNKTLKFIVAPNLHWPDTMFTYIEEEKVLVTCDAFGCHYCDESITNDKIKNKDDYLAAIDWYFTCIMSPFKKDVLNGIEKIKDLDIEVLAVGHGPVIVENPNEVIEIYKKLAQDNNPNEKTTVVIPYVSAYGYTKKLAEKITEGIESAGDIEVKLHDMVYAKKEKVLEELSQSDGFLLGTPTMVGEALEPIWELTASMNTKVYGHKPVSAFGSYGWSGEAVPHILERLKQIGGKIFGEGLKFRFKPSVEEEQKAFEFGKEFGEFVLDEKK